MNLNDVFITGGVYKSKRMEEGVFLCSALKGKQIGKLTWYKELGDRIYKRTGISYFLNDYKDGDIKELFVSREDYDMVGRVDINYIEQQEYLLKV